MAIVRRSRRILLPGPVLIGFADLFDRSYGDPRTSLPLVKVTPSCIGGVLLPFTCPHCGAVRSAVIDAKTRLGYYDKERGFSWCPTCRGRYIIQPKGRPLEKALPAGATHAPALVERGDTAELVGLATADGLDMLGAC